MERKIQESNDKRLLKARSNTLKRKIIMIYRNEFNKEFRAAIQKKEFDRIAAAIRCLKTNAGKEFTNSQIATWIFNNYSEEAERKMQASTDKRLLNITNKLERKKIVIRIYMNELNRRLNSSLQKIEPKIKITKRGCRARYCYIDNTDKIFDKYAARISFTA